MTASSPSIFPSIGQIVRRCVGLLRAIDLVHSFRCYTSLVLLVDILRHGAHYMVLPSMLEAVLRRSHSSHAGHAAGAEGSEIAAATAAAALGFLLTALSQVAQGVGPSGLLDSWTLGGSAAAARKPHHGADWPVVLPTGRAVGTAGAYWGEGMCLGKRKRKQRERASAERKPGNVTETRMTIEHWRPLGAKTVGHTLALHSAESEAPERMSEDRAKTEARTRRGKEMETGRPIRSANEQFEL
ncbi:gapN [Symbiodinium sp. KB8]|nr:gapN [Symbiodinium sp. KB8]